MDPANSTRPDAPPVAIVVSRYNGSVTSRLREGAEAAHAARCPGGGLDVIEAPGAYELIAIGAAAAKTGRYRGVVALGCVIKGETDHDRYINEAVANSLGAATVETGVPIGFGLVTTNDVEQAMDRAGGTNGNKGADAMDAVLDSIAAIDAIRGADEYGLRVTLKSDPNDKAAG
ncbi:MAG: 6,7-dimethyl-8-ribityllumazine synthase [Planctomycetota bacterium]